MDTCNSIGETIMLNEDKREFKKLNKKEYNTYCVISFMWNSKKCELIYGDKSGSVAAWEQGQGEVCQLILSANLTRPQGAQHLVKLYSRCICRSVSGIRLTFESIDWVKRVALLNVGKPYLINWRPE